MKALFKPFPTRFWQLPDRSSKIPPQIILPKELFKFLEKTRDFTSIHDKQIRTIHNLNHNRLRIRLSETSKYTEPIIAFWKNQDNSYFYEVRDVNGSGKDWYNILLNGLESGKTIKRYGIKFKENYSLYRFFTEDFDEQLTTLEPDEIKAIEQEVELEVQETEEPQKEQAFTFAGDNTSKKKLVEVRTHQTVFKRNLMKVERRCRFTGLSDDSILISSHIKKWSKCTHQERIDGNNGLLCAPNVDKLFDKHLISFEDNGDLIVSPLLPVGVLEAFGIKYPHNYGAFNSRQRVYLVDHRAKLRNEEPLMPLDNPSQPANISVDRNTIAKETLEKDTSCTVKPVEVS